MNIKEQIDEALVTFSEATFAIKSNKRNLCNRMTHCPTSVIGTNKDTNNTCDNCIGMIPLKELKTIEPELNKYNLQKTIKIWQVLIK